MNIPRMNKDGPMRASAWNALLDYIRSMRILPGVNVLPIISSCGTALIGAAKSIGGRSGIPNHSFQIFSAPVPNDDPDNPEPSSYEVTILPGTINGLMPDGIIEDGELKKYTVGKNGINYVVLTGQSNGSSITNASISLRSSPASHQEAVLFGLPSKVEILLGAVTGGTVRQVVNSNMWLRAVITSITEKSDPPPGAQPLDVWCVWGI